MSNFFIKRVKQDLFQRMRDGSYTKSVQERAIRRSET